jgi:hypothetical protein
MIELKNKYGLDENDFYHGEDKTVIVKRTGIKKIRERAEIEVDYEVVGCGIDWCVVLATGRIILEEPIPNHTGMTLYKEAQSIGSATPKNCSFQFPHEVAEYRAEARVVLELIGLKKQKVFSEDEMRLEEELKKGSLVTKAKKMSTAGEFKAFVLRGEGKDIIGNILEVHDDTYTIQPDGTKNKIEVNVEDVLKWSTAEHPYMKDQRGVSDAPKIIKLLAKKQVTSENYKEYKHPKHRTFSKLVGDAPLIDILTVISNKINN